MKKKALHRLDRMHNIYVTLSSISRNDIMLMKSKSDSLTSELEELVDWTDRFEYRDLAESFRLRRISTIHGEIEHIRQYIHILQEQYFMHERTADFIKSRRNNIKKAQVREEEEDFLNEFVSINHKSSL